MTGTGKEMTRCPSGQRVSYIQAMKAMKAMKKGHPFGCPYVGITYFHGPSPGNYRRRK